MVQPVLDLLYQQDRFLECTSNMFLVVETVGSARIWLIFIVLHTPEKVSEGGSRGGGGASWPSTLALSSKVHGKYK